MKTLMNIFGGLFIIVGLTALSGFLYAQETATPDSIVQIVADSQGLTLASPGQIPRGGTFWWILPSGAAVPLPCPPQDYLTTPIYQMGDQWLVDETAGAIPASPRRFGLQAQTMSGTAVSGLEMEADTIMNLIARVQATTVNQQARALARTMGTSSFHSDAAGMDILDFGDGGGDYGTNDYEYTFTPLVYTTN